MKYGSSTDLAFITLIICKMCDVSVLFCKFINHLHTGALLLQVNIKGVVMHLTINVFSGDIKKMLNARTKETQMEYLWNESSNQDWIQNNHGILIWKMKFFFQEKTDIHDIVWLKTYSKCTFMHVAGLNMLVVAVR